MNFLDMLTQIGLETPVCTKDNSAKDMLSKALWKHVDLVRFSKDVARCIHCGTFVSMKDEEIAKLEYNKVE
jgi:hypothetical protein